MNCLICGGKLNPKPVLKGRDILHSIPGEFEIKECFQCRSGITFPLVSDQELDSFYPKNYLPHEKPTGLLGKVMDIVQRLRMRNDPLKRVTNLKPGNALDVGLGRGDLGAELIRRGWQVSGIDPDPGALKEAEKRGIQTYQGILKTVQVDVPENGFDLIIFQHCLEHVTDPQGDLKIALDMLSQNGILIITLPNWSCWQRRFFRSKWFPLELPRHRTHLTEKGLKQALLNAGARDTEALTTTSFICFFWSLQYLFFNRLVTEKGIGLLIGYGLAALSWPIAKLLNSRSGGDFLHVIARK